MSKHIEAIENELTTVADMIVQLDDKIQQLKDQKERMLVVQDAFTKAKSLMDEQTEMPLAVE